MAKYFIFIFIISLCLILYCSKDNSPLSLTDEFGTGTDYKIYSLVLNKASAGEPSQMILLSDSTIHWDITQMYKTIQTKFNYIDQETLDSYQSLNQERIKLLNIPYLNIKCILIPEGTEWKKKFPEASGIYHLSRIGYNLDCTQALVYVSAYSAPLVASGSLIYLEKEENWIIKKTIMGWIS